MAQLQPFTHPQGTSAHHFLEGGVFQHRLIVAQGKEEHSALTIGVVIGHDVGLVAAGVIGVHEVVRAAWVVLEVVQLVGHGKVFEAGGNGVIESEMVTVKSMYGLWPSKKPLSIWW